MAMDHSVTGISPSSSATSLSSTFTGRVVSVNDRGLRLDGHESWFNVSRFAAGVVLPERGAAVTVSVDGKGFLRAVAPADGAESLPPTASTAPLPVAGGSHGPTDKDRTITRLAVLKAAAEFGAARPQLKSGEVLAIAESWERWVLRSMDPTDDLNEAL